MTTFIKMMIIVAVSSKKCSSPFRGPTCRLDCPTNSPKPKDSSFCIIHSKEKQHILPFTNLELTNAWLFAWKKIINQLWFSLRCYHCSFNMIMPFVYAVVFPGSQWKSDRKPEIFKNDQAILENGSTYTSFFFFLTPGMYNTPWLDFPSCISSPGA